MHQIAIPDYILQRVKARRGKLTVFDRLEGKSTALLVIDLQNAFILPGMPDAAPVAGEIIPNVNSLAKAVREVGGTVVWIKMTMQGQTESWNVFFDYFSSPADKAAAVKALSPGDPGHELHADLDVRPQDLTVEKTRFSAFIQGSSDLDRILRERGIDTVLVTGAVSNTCCECTARDAMMLNYKTLFIADANAARSDDEHNVTLANMLRMFADVPTTAEAIKRLV